MVSKLVEIVDGYWVSHLEGNHTKRIILANAFLLIFLVFSIVVRDKKPISFQLIHLTIFGLSSFSTLSGFFCLLRFLWRNCKHRRNLKQLLKILLALAVIISCSIFWNLDLYWYVVNQREVSKNRGLYHVVNLPVTVKRIQGCFLVLGENVYLFAIGLLNCFLLNHLWIIWIHKKALLGLIKPNLNEGFVFRR